jgi:hypothetical protein
VPTAVTTRPYSSFGNSNSLINDICLAATLETLKFDGTSRDLPAIDESEFEHLARPNRNHDDTLCTAISNTVAINNPSLQDLDTGGNDFGALSLPSSATKYNSMQRYDPNFRPVLSAGGGLVAVQNTKTGAAPAVMATARQLTAPRTVRQPPAAVAAAPRVVDLVDTDDENDNKKECTVGKN